MKVSRSALRILACVALAATLAPARLGAQTAFKHFNYCAPPTPPSCVEAVADASEKKLKACETDVERYVASVFAYRGCIAAETERAVREANATIRKMRCARDPAFCPQQSAEPEPAPSRRRKKSKKK